MVILEELACDKCDIHIVKPYHITLIKKDGTKKKLILCKECKNDFKKNFKFTKDKVKHDYKGAWKYLSDLYKAKGMKLRKM